MLSTNDALYSLVYVCRVKVAMISEEASNRKKLHSTKKIPSSQLARAAVIMVSREEIRQIEVSILLGVHIQVFLRSPLQSTPIISKTKELHRPTTPSPTDRHFDMNKYPSHQREFPEVKSRGNCGRRSRMTSLH